MELGWRLTLCFILWAIYLAQDNTILVSVLTVVPCAVGTGLVIKHINERWEEIIMRPVYACEKCIVNTLVLIYSTIVAVCCGCCALIRGRSYPRISNV